MYKFLTISLFGALSLGSLSLAEATPLKVNSPIEAVKPNLSSDCAVAIEQRTPNFFNVYLRANGKFPQIVAGTALALISAFLLNPTPAIVFTHNMSESEIDKSFKTMEFMHARHNVQKEVSRDEAGQVYIWHRGYATMVLEKLILYDLRHYSPNKYPELDGISFRPDIEDLTLNFYYSLPEDDSTKVRLKLIAESIKNIFKDPELQSAAELHIARLAVDRSYRAQKVYNDLSRSIFSKLLEELQKVFSTAEAELYIRRFRDLGSEIVFKDE